ncbi:hypothetical protein V6N13_104693 [Hibiscus sabdariffa]
MSSSGEGSNGGLVMNEGGTDTDVREWYRRLVCVGYCGRLVLGVSVKGSNDGEDLERWGCDSGVGRWKLARRRLCGSWCLVMVGRVRQ